MNKVYEQSDEQFLLTVKSSLNYSDVMRKLSLVSSGGSTFKLMKRRIKELDIDVSHFSTTIATNKQKYSLDEILVCDSHYTNMSSLKKRLVAENYMEYKCSCCSNNGIWQNSELTLQLDHINGVNDDHRIENLRFLCPNCHSQTSTYAGRNKT